MGTGGDVPIYYGRKSGESRRRRWAGQLGLRCLTEGGGEEEDDDEEVFAAASLAVSFMLAAGEAVGVVPAVAVAAGSVFALGLRPRLAGSLGESSSWAALTELAGSSGLTSGMGWGVLRMAS